MTKEEARRYEALGYKFIYFENSKKHGNLAYFSKGNNQAGYTAIAVPVKSLPLRELEICIAYGVTYV